jgi:hypothetical protein
MAEFDYAIAGTSLLSGLVAGVLARDYGKKVARVGRPRSAQRLPRSLDLAALPATRAETWRMLRRAEAETATLLGSMGIPEGIKTSEMEFAGDFPGTAAALDHLAHMALGHGHQVRKVQGGWALRLVTMLDVETIDRRMGEWLEAAGVVSLAEGTIDAGSTVLADDEAIFDTVAEDGRPALLVSQPMTSTLVVSPRPLHIAVRRFVDRGITLAARPGNTLLAIVSGEADVDARLASVLTGPFPMKRLATTRYRRFATADGAPLIGKLGDWHLVAGLGDTASFFAPAIARLLTGASDSEEARWFAAHDPSADRASIADFVSAAEAKP